MAFGGVEMVESVGYVTRELEVLGLVFANGYMGGVVKEDVSGLQDWIGEKTEFD